MYLLHPNRKSILLYRSEKGPFPSQYVALSAPWNEAYTPVEIARKLISAKTDLDFVFLGFGPAMPMLLDERTVRIFPPFQLQITVLDAKNELVDYVYLAQAKVAPEFPKNGKLNWFTQSTTKNSPNHVKHLVHHILTMVH